jgi:transcription initiation factor IIE alpha subunit
METHQMLELLLDRMDANTKGMEEMMNANQAKTNANLKEMREEIISG